MARAAKATPQELYGPLLAAVQESEILADGKTFVDAVPKRPVADIMADFAHLRAGTSELRQFVAANFDLPPSVAPAVPQVSAVPLREHIRALWANLARGPEAGAANSSALPIGHRHVVPGGRFREIYYWDSFFTMLGLVRDGERELASGTVDAMTDLIEAHGHVPNGARTYFLGRSQPPVYHMMVALLGDERPEVAARRLAAMKREHAWWMEGAADLAPGDANRHVARLADGSLLNRYWDPRITPRDESWREDVETAADSGRPPADVYRELRAGAESGWDFSSRWLEGGDLASIRTTQLAPIDLNSFLYGLERAIAASGDADAAIYAERAAARRAAIQRHCWYETNGLFGDYDLAAGAIRLNPTAASLAALFCEVATATQAAKSAEFVRAHMLAPGGLRTTLVETGQQWDSPNGWAPLQWIAVSGLKRYGHDALARDIALRWIGTVEATYARTGLLYEKYDIEARNAGGGGEYAAQVGFGWTNGVTGDLMDDYAVR